MDADADFLKKIEQERTKYEAALREIVKLFTESGSRDFSPAMARVAEKALRESQEKKETV